MKAYYFLFLSVPLFLSSCFSLNPYSDKFACPGYRPGVCASIPDVYKAYKKGELLSSESDDTESFSTYAPLDCKVETVCKVYCDDPCDGKPKRECRKVRVCDKDSVRRHVDYRAEAVKDNSPKEVVVW